MLRGVGRGGEAGRCVCWTRQVVVVVVVVVVVEEDAR
jgi:hypothetical protein